MRIRPPCSGPKPPRGGAFMLANVRPGRDRTRAPARGVAPCRSELEQVDVKPDIAVPADDAQKTAHAAILRSLIAQADDDRRKARLQAALTDLEAQN